MLVRLYELRDHRDARKFIEGIFLGMLGCVLLYTLFAFLLVRVHADQISAKMLLLLKYDMTPLIMPKDVHLNGFLHRWGSALLIGIPLGLSTALFTAVASILPWIRGSWGRPIDFVFTALLLPAYFRLSFSGEVPALSVLCGILTPFFFYGPWIWTVRRGKSRRRSRLRLVLFGSLIVVPCLLCRNISLLDIRDALIDSPIGRRITDFYYSHTLLAAHVIKPLTRQTQKVIAISKDIELPRTLPHGTLWIQDDDPCSIAGSSIVASKRSLNCPCLLVSDTDRVNLGNRIMAEGSRRFDKNKALRRGIRFFIQVSAAVTIFLIMLWLVLVVEDIYQRHRGAALALCVCLLLLTAPSVAHRYRIHLLNREPNKVHEYVHSGCVDKRWIGLRHFPDLLTVEETESLARDRSTKIRHQALLLIGEQGDKKFLPLIKARTKDPELIVRTKACWALGETGGEEARMLLNKAIAEDSSWYVRDYAYKAMGRIQTISKATEKM